MKDSRQLQNIDSQFNLDLLSIFNNIKENIFKFILFNVFFIALGYILIFSFISSSFAKEYIKDFDFNDADFIQSKYDVKYFINDGYKLVQQETSGTTTGYVLKKGDEYVGCRSVGLSKDQTCYIIVLKRVE